MSTAFSPIAITTTPADVVRGWIGEATRLGRESILVQRMAEGIDATTADVHAIARGSASHLDQLLDVEIVQRLAGSVGQSALSLSYRTVLRYDLPGMGDMLEDEDEDRAAMDEDEDKPMRYRFVMSDALPDRADDIVEQTWDLSEFAANPVAPYNHDYSAPPIGRWQNVRATGGVLRGTLVPVAVESYPLSMTVAALLEQKVLRTVSVGLRPAAVIARASLPEEDTRYADRGAVYVRPKLLEASVTPMPMNPRAALARSVTAQPVARSISSAAEGLPWSKAQTEPSSARFPWS